MTAEGLVPLFVVGSTALVVARGQDRPLTLAVALAPAWAFGILSLGFFLWRFIDGDGAAFGRLAWLACTVVAVWAARRLLGGQSAVRARTPIRMLTTLSAVCTVTAVAVALTAFWLHARQSPLGQFDAWAIWSSRARLLYLAPHPSEAFSLLRRAHPDYPLLLPSSLAAQFEMVGGVSRQIPLWTGAIFPFAAGAVICEGIRRLGAPREAGWTAAALLLATPQMTYWGFAQCADVPLGYLLALASLALATLGERGIQVPGGGLAAGFFVGLLAWTKNEGMILSLLLLGLFLLVKTRSRPGRKLLLRVVAGAAVPWLAVILFKVVWKPNSDLPFLLAEPWQQIASMERWSYVLGAFFERLNPASGFRDWGLVWLLLAAGVVLAWHRGGGRDGPVKFLLLVVALCWSTWLAVFIATPLDIEWHVRTALDRLILQLLPLTLMTVFAAAATAKLDEAT